MSYSFQTLLHLHWPQVRSVYLEGIATGQATFQQDAPEWDQWDQAHLPHSRIVMVKESEVVGWAALIPVSSRTVYRGVAEVSIYIGERYRGNSLGFQLLKELMHQSEENGIWTLQSSIFPENEASIHIHEKCGFRIIGRREKIGQQNGTWRDTIMMERRSKKTGI
jgi:L-amino acid N-acyltransferase YncA